MEFLLLLCAIAVIFFLMFKFGKIVENFSAKQNGGAASIDLSCNTATSWPDCLIKDKDGNCSGREQEQRKILENMKTAKCTIEKVKNDIESAVTGHLNNVRGKISGCMGKKNGDCVSCSYKTWYPGYPCCKDTCGPWWARYGCDCHVDCERGWRSHSLSNSECEAYKSATSFACNAFQQLPSWNC